MTSNDTEIRGRTIQLFLADGVSTGLTIASIHGWTGSVLVASQSAFARLVARPEVDRTGVYILFGPDPNDPFRMRAYIGEADSVRSRISQSAAERAFWETAVVITTSDDALTKGHVRYLEARLIAIARDSKRAILDNGQLPDADRRYLPEADRANMEAFLGNLRVILPVVGLDLLKAQPKALSKVGDAASVSIEGRFEIRHKSGITATAIEEDGEFIVLAGSKALKDSGYQSNTYAELKKELIEEGILVAVADGSAYEFKEAHKFRSPSAAAAVVLDRNSNGRTEWKISGEKKTYHEWQEQKAALMEQSATK